MRPEARIPAIIDDLYAGTLDSTAWSRGMIALADLVGGSGTLLLGLNPATAHIFRDEIHRFDPAAVIEYRNHWIAQDVRFAPLLRVPVGEAGFESKLMPTVQLRQSAIYNDYLLRVDSPYFLVFWLHKTAIKVVVLSIQGSRRRGPFGEEDGEQIKPLLTHVARALEIKDRLEVVQIRCDALVTGLNSVQCGVLTLDASGCILDANVLGEQLLCTENGIRKNAEGRLSLRGAAGRELEKWILTGIPPAHNRDGLLHVARPLLQPLSLLVTRLPESAGSWICAGSPRWMILVFDPERRLSVSTALIARDLTITEREAEIAALLCAGYGINALAQRLGISIHTARTHVKAIFSRTGIRSQAELVRRIASGPAAAGAAH